MTEESLEIGQIRFITYTFTTRPPEMFLVCKIEKERGVQVYFLRGHKLTWVLLNHQLFFQSQILK